MPKSMVALALAVAAGVAVLVATATASMSRLPLFVRFTVTLPPDAVWVIAWLIVACAAAVPLAMAPTSALSPAALVIVRVTVAPASCWKMRPLAVLLTFAVTAGVPVANTPKKQSALVASAQIVTVSLVVSVPAAGVALGPNVSCGAARAGVADRAESPRAATDAPVRSAIRRLIVVMYYPLFLAAAAAVCTLWSASPAGPRPSAQRRGPPHGRNIPSIVSLTARTAEKQSGKVDWNCDFPPFLGSCVTLVQHFLPPARRPCLRAAARECRWGGQVRANCCSS